MTYKDQFVVEVKCNGKILRVKDDVVSLPFGCEYSIYLKNLDSRKAALNIHIDGQNVLDNSSLILEPNSSTDLKGFLSGSLVKNKFKFIQKTKEIQDHRGDKIDDGIIRVEFAFKKLAPEVIKKTIIHEHHHNHDCYYYPKVHWNYNDWFDGDSTIKYSSDADPLSSYTYNNSGEVKGMTAENCSRGFASSNYMVQSDSLGIESLGAPLDDEGITVKGSECNQSFRYGAIGELIESKVIIIRMKGFQGSSGVVVNKPITTKSRLTCSSCGKKSKSSFKYCPNCGTYLE